MDWFVYDNGLRLERVKHLAILLQKSISHAVKYINYFTRGENGAIKPWGVILGGMLLRS